MTLDEFIKEVDEMRKLQNWYFQNKNKASLRDAKVQEKIVDKMIYDYKVERINTSNQFRNMERITNILMYSLPPAFLGSAITWLANRKKSKNDFLNDLQDSINRLVDENKKLLEKVLALQSENINLLNNQETMKLELNKLRSDNQKLLQQVKELKLKIERK